MKFSHIAALHSELVAVSIDGRLHQWKWSDAKPIDATPGQHSHSRAAEMKLYDEKIVALDACNVRASVLTESGKVSVSNGFSQLSTLLRENAFGRSCVKLASRSFG